MKIIKPGTMKLYVPPAPWWGQQGECKQCGAIVEIEPDDEPTAVAATDHAPRHAEMVCPTSGCRSMIWFYPP